MSKVYLDNAATTSMYDEVIDAMIAGMKINYGNPSSTHYLGRETKGIIENIRKKIAKTIGAQSSEIIFTSGGTEANNLILRSCIDFLGIERIISSKLEHSCVMETVNSLNLTKGITLDFVKNNELGEIDLVHLEELLKNSDQKTIISIMHANNEIGNLNPILEIGALAEKYGAFYHSDMVQSFAHYELNLDELPVDFASCSAHKFHGPKGVGFAYIKKDTGLKAQITGGGQERNMRSGTENVHGILGLGKAFEISYERLLDDEKFIKDLKVYAIESLKSRIPEIVFNGNSGNLDKSLYTVLSLSLPFKDGLIGFELDLHGIAVSQGSACQSGASKASRVLSEIWPEEFLNQTTPLRISFSSSNQKEDIDQLVNVLEKLQAKYSS